MEKMGAVRIIDQRYRSKQGGDRWSYKSQFPSYYEKESQKAVDNPCHRKS